MALPVALGLYSVRDLYRNDFHACLAQVRQMGYAGVECFSAPTLPAGDVASALAKEALSLVGWHLPIESLEGDALDKTADYLSEVGCTRAIVPFMPPETFQTRPAVLAFARRMEGIRERLLPHGIALGYHNHDAEFLPLPDGALPWAVLMDHARIIPQLDTGNALSSRTPGLSLTGLIEKWPGRAETIHLKPYSRAQGFESMIGADDTDWLAVLDAAVRTGGTQWLIVEYEEDGAYGQLEGARACLRALERFL